MRKIFLGLILCCISAEVSADWTMLQTNDDGNMYIDFDSLKKSGDLITVLSLNDYYVAQEKQGLSSQWLELIDCKNKKFKALAIHYYSENMGKGDVIASTRFNATEISWSALVQYSVGELKINIVCSR
ncbi:MAG: hypothetical protein EXR38_06815 [Methylotenera sp.]|nr:hypothetical protein [Methylotenera sp.]MSQ00182.1 hypothetical protein [Methylotenera sp.]